MLPADRDRLRVLVRDQIRVGTFTLSSGRTSNYYVDLRLLTLDPESAYLGAVAMIDLVADLDIQAIGGPTMGADPMAGAIAAISHSLGKPVRGFMVRKAPKSHGAGRVVEGPVEPGMRVVVVDDTTTTGGSMLTAIEQVRAFGCEVVAAACLLDREEGAREAFADAGFPFRAAFRISDLGLTS